MLEVSVSHQGRKDGDGLRGVPVEKAGRGVCAAERSKVDVGGLAVIIGQRRRSGA